MKTNLARGRDVDNEFARDHGVLEEQARDLLHCHGSGGAVREVYGDPNTSSAGDVLRSSFGMILSTCMTQ